MEDYFLVVMMTAPSEAEAAMIGRTVVEEGLSACCNILPDVRSIYRWQGEICDEAEVLCIMKTRSGLFNALKERIIELHSYEVPEVIAVRIDAASDTYLKWIDDSTAPLDQR